MKYDGPERRYIHRHHMSCIALRMKRRQRLPFLRGAGTCRCDVTDMSWRGVRFHSDSRLKPGTVVEITLDCPLDVGEFEQPSFKVRVAWQRYSRTRRAWRTGASFIDLPEKAREAILAIIDKAVEHDRRFNAASQDFL